MSDSKSDFDLENAEYEISEEKMPNGRYAYYINVSEIPEDEAEQEKYVERLIEKINKLREEE